MIDCRRTAERLPSFVDDTLRDPERAEVARHLDACPPCREAAEAERGGREALRQCAPRLRSVDVPPALRSRCDALARAHCGARRRAIAGGWHTRLVPTLLTAAMLVLTAIAVFSLATLRSNTVLAAQLTADHAKCFKLFGSPGAPGADARLVESMLSQEYGWDVHVPPSSIATGIKLLGARRCLYGEGSIPHVMYDVNGHEVSLYVLEGVTRRPDDLVTLGHRSRIWTRGTNTYVLVSSTTAGELGDAARYVMAEAH